MKIAFFVSAFPVRSETFIVHQITGLIDRGQEVHVFASLVRDRSQLHGEFERYKLLDLTRRRRVAAPGASLRARLAARLRLLIFLVWRHPVVVFRTLNFLKYGRRALTLDLLEMASCFLERPSYDVVHCHFGENGNDAAILMELGLLRGKLVVTFHSYDVLKGVESKGRIYRRLVNRADTAHSISEYNRQWLEKFGFPVSRIHYHPMGIDLERFATQRKKRPLDERVTILTVARLFPAKGLEYGLAALAEVCRQRPEVGLRYRIIGGGPLAAGLKRKATELRLDGIVEFCGPQDQELVRGALADADLFFLPSLAEALPVAIMEAMASGLPIIATDVGSVAELVRDGQTGRLVPPADVAALSAAILDMLDRKEDWFRLGEAGRRLVSSRHDASQLNDRLLEHYAALAGHRRSTVPARDMWPAAG